MRSSNEDDCMSKTSLGSESDSSVRKNASKSTSEEDLGTAASADVEDDHNYLSFFGGLQNVVCVGDGHGKEVTNANGGSGHGNCRGNPSRIHPGRPCRAPR